MRKLSRIALAWMGFGPADKVSKPAPETQEEEWPEHGREIAHAPIGGRGHTNYRLLRGATPRSVKVIPKANFGLTTREHQDEIRELVKQRGFVLENIPERSGEGPS